MSSTVDSVRLHQLPHDFAENGDLTVMEGLTHVPFSIARVFVVRGFEGSVRGQHAHINCMQFLTCPYGRIEVQCDDGMRTATFILDRPDLGLLLPPTIWAQQTYLQSNSVLTVLCDRPYDADDYIRSYSQFKKFRSSKI